jgi:phage gp29-like protein
MSFEEKANAISGATRKERRALSAAHHSLTQPREGGRFVKQRTNGKNRVDSASTISTPIANLQRIVRPQALFRWLGPQLAAITPAYIEQTMIGAMQGSTLQAWSIFDLMLKTWPELLACYTELIYGVLRKKLVYEPYHEEDEKPTPSAIEKQKLVACAIRSMTPDPARDDSAIEGTIKDVLDAWFRGVAVSEILWQSIDDANIGTIMAPQSTFSVDPTNYAWSSDGSLGLRSNKQSAMSMWPFATTSLSPRPDEVQAFPDNKFLVAVHKASGGSPLGGALLRPLAWWWCAANFSSDWLLNLAQIFGIPFRWATYDPNATPETIAMLDNMLQNMGSNAWGRGPTGTEIQFISPPERGSDHSPQGELMDRADRYARTLILGQTMTGSHGTTGKGGGQAFGKIEHEVKDDRIDAAGKFATTVLNQQLVSSILMLNYGNTDEMPSMKFLEDEVADLVEAQRDQVLINAGLPIGVDYLRKKYDIPEPAEGEEIVGGVSLDLGREQNVDDPLNQPLPDDPNAPPTDPKQEDVKSKLARLNAIEDDAVFSRELLQLTKGMK